MEQYQDKVARIQSGEGVLSGTVTRTSKTSIWVKFPGLEEMRFVRSQDGAFRRYGRSTEQNYPVLVFPHEVPATPEKAQEALDAEAAAGNRGFHGKVTLTGKEHRYANGERWYEIEWVPAEYFPGGKGWVSWDAPVDTRAPEPATLTALTGWEDGDLAWT